MWFKEFPLRAQIEGIEGKDLLLFDIKNCSRFQGWNGKPHLNHVNILTFTG